MMYKQFINLFLLFALTSGLCQSYAKSPLSAVEVQELAISQLFQQLKDGQYWDFPSYLGLHHTSQQVLLMDYLGYPSELDTSRFIEMLMEAQLEDGSWYVVLDANDVKGDINATILNYMFLKTRGTPLDSPEMVKARQWILKYGGLGKSSFMTQMVLALFGNLKWRHIPRISLDPFQPVTLYSVDNFAQWVRPHLPPMAYIRYYKLKKEFPRRYSLTELQGVAPQTDMGTKILLAPPASNNTINSSGFELVNQNGFTRWETKKIENIIKRILERQRQFGTWGGYTVATLFSLIALQDYEKKVPSYSPKIQQAFSLALPTLINFMNNSGESSMLGVLDDGHLWDTALIARALLSSGVSPKKLEPVVDYLVSKRAANNGFYFGRDFEVDPDADDTAAVLMLLQHYPKHRDVASKAISWLLSMQNFDGGWAAFSKNNYGNPIVDLFTRRYLDSVDLYDESSPDITGHVLEALGQYGYTVENNWQVAEAVKYLRSTQDERISAWDARWGVNYIYGTQAVISGLKAVDEDMDSSYVIAALDWLESKQNDDGGFGESTKSYVDLEWAGRGLSTASQTAWALMALNDGGRTQNKSAALATKFLLEMYSSTGKWFDASTVGTGHPIIVYMNYPSYPMAFPLIALKQALQ